MPGKKNITILKTETAKKILAKKDAGRTSGGGRSGARATVKNPPPVYGRPQLIKIVAEANEKGGYYKVKPVVRDVSSGTSNQEETKENKWFDPDLTDEMYGLEITGAAGIAADNKKAYLATPIVDSNGRLLWAFSRGGGVSEYWVTITSVTSPSEYVGTVREEPTGNVLESEATITVYGATANEFAVGYADWAKKKTNSEGEDIYYLNGYLLG